MKPNVQIRGAVQGALHTLLHATKHDVPYHYLIPLSDGCDPERDKDTEPDTIAAARAILASAEAQALVEAWNRRVTPHLDPLRFVRIYA